MASHSEDRRTLKFWIWVWLPVLAGICVIAIESSMYFGADQTTRPLRWLFESIFGHMDNERWDTIHHLIRKSGHFLGYGTIGLLWLRAWWMSLPRSRFVTDFFLALLGTALVASSDEFHQSFLPNRTGIPSDVLLDCCGAVALQLIVYLYLRLRWPKRLVRAA